MHHTKIHALAAWIFFLPQAETPLPNFRSIWNNYKTAGMPVFRIFKHAGTDRGNFFGKHTAANHCAVFFTSPN